ncbi:uncharacterized protein LOC144169780 [Haemaphysalis longicornis]
MNPEKPGKSDGSWSGAVQRKHPDTKSDDAAKKPEIKNWIQISRPQPHVADPRILSAGRGWRTSDLSMPAKPSKSDESWSGVIQKKHLNTKPDIGSKNPEIKNWIQISRPQPHVTDPRILGAGRGLHNKSDNGAKNPEIKNWIQISRPQPHVTDPRILGAGRGLHKSDDGAKKPEIKNWIPFSRPPPFITDSRILGAGRGRHTNSEGGAQKPESNGCVTISRSQAPVTDPKILGAGRGRRPMQGW